MKLDDFLVELVGDGHITGTAEFCKLKDVDKYRAQVKVSSIWWAKKKSGSGNRPTRFPSLTKKERERIIISRG